MVGSIVAAAAGYLLGAIPTADIVSRVAGRPGQVRNEGTGNPGAANTTKVLGVGPGVAVAVGDVAKAFVAGRVGGRVAGDAGVHVAATAAVIGHCAPPWPGVDGGKGVAASVGQVLASFPAYLPIDMAVATATWSVGSQADRARTAAAVASATWVGSAVLWWRRGWPNLWGPRPTGALPTAAAVSATVIAWRFRGATEVPDVVAADR